MAAKDDKVAVKKGAKNYGRNVVDAPRKEGTTFRPTNYGKNKSGLPGIDQQIANFNLDRSRDFQNFVGDYGFGGNFWTGKPMTKSGGRGDALYGSNPGDWRKPKKTKKTKDTDTSTGEQYSSFLDEMFGGGSGGGGGGGGSRRAYSDADIAASQAKLQALYNRYAADILAQQDNINKNYAAGATNLGSAYDTAVGNINKSYDAARAEQTRQLLALGMTEQTPIQNVSAQVGDTSSLERLRAAVLAQNEASRNAAITNQRLASEAASREGAGQIANVIAQMQQATVSGGGGGGGGGTGGLSAKDYASLKLKEMQMIQDAEIAASKQASRGSGVQLVNNIMKQNPNLTVEQATNIAKLG